MSDNKFSVGKAILIGAGAAVAAAAAFGAVMYRQFKKDVQAGCGDDFCDCVKDHGEGETEINQGSYACVEKSESEDTSADDTVTDDDFADSECTCQYDCADTDTANDVEDDVNEEEAPAEA